MASAYYLVVSGTAGRDWELKDTTVMIKGHSRGAVAAAMFARKLQAAGFKVEAALFDPVPGPEGMRTERDKSLSQADYLEQDLSGTESTVVYSMASGYGYLIHSFKPMVAKGVKRIMDSRTATLRTRRRSTWAAA